MRTDLELVEAAGAGDRSAWEDLVDRYGQLVFANARAAGADHSLSNDVSQMVWIRLLDRLDTIREPSKIKGWLAIVARNTARSELRRTKPTASYDQLFNIADDEPGPLDSITRSGDAVNVRHAFAALSEKCRELLTLLFGAELSYDEVAEVIGMPIGSIGPTRARCLSSLQSHLEPGHGRITDGSVGVSPRNAHD